ncbi:MAG TPA: ABC transporter permease [Terriglobales bacterium]|nr:ABC transporter permease [Terriglobales bacterium]
MLKHLFPNELALGFAQAGVTAVLAIIVGLVARRRDIHVEWETVVALVRGLAQIVAVGFILVLMLKGPQWTSAFMLSAMVVAAGATSARRTKKLPGSFAVSFWSILVGSGSVIALMTWAGVIDGTITSIVPVGSMIIANAMNTNALALERFRSEVEAHMGEIESALALGAAPEVSVSPEMQKSFSASLIPALNNLRSLGLVWIPGLMAGMVLSGSSPLYSAIYQFVVIAMIFGSSGLTALMCTTLIRKRIFTSAEQLVLLR